MMCAGSVVRKIATSLTYLMVFPADPRLQYQIFALPAVELGLYRRYVSTKQSKTIHTGSFLNIWGDNNVEHQSCCGRQHSQ